jgi:hypothetical protein
MDHFRVDATDAGFAVDDGIVVLAPTARAEALDAGLQARLAE